MEGKRLYFSKKSCDSAFCANYHSILLNQIETTITVLFDMFAINHGISPIPVSLLEATHIQYIDINGTMHIYPFGTVVEPISDIVNFRLLRSFELFRCYPSMETTLEPVIELYEKHLQKTCLEMRV